MITDEIIKDIKRQLANYNNEEDALVGLVGEGANTLLAEIDRLTHLLEAAPKECERCPEKARAERATLLLKNIFKED